MTFNLGVLLATTPAIGSPIRFKVLVVDQPGPNLEYFVEVLREVGYNVDAASDSETTYRKLRNSVRPVDLMIVDLECLHEVDGFRFLKILKKQEFCVNTELIITTHRLIDERLSPTSRDLAIHACFNKARPIEELVCLATAILPPRGHNLRVSPRFPVRFLVHYTIGATRYPYYATNLSRGGMFILKLKPDLVGTQVELAFTLPGSTVPLNVTARVVRAVHQALDVETSRYQMFPPGNGLAFVQMTRMHQRILNEFCECEESRIFGTLALPITACKDKNTCQLTQ